MLLLLNCSSMVLLSRNSGCLMLLLSLVLLLLLLLLVVDLNHARMIAHIMMRRRRRWRLLLDDRWSLIILVWNRHWRLLHGQVNQRSKCFMSLHVVVRWRDKMQPVGRRAGRFGPSPTASVSTASNRVVPLDYSLPLWRGRCSVWTRSAENRRYPIDVVGR